MQSPIMQDALSFERDPVIRKTTMWGAIFFGGSTFLVVLFTALALLVDTGNKLSAQQMQISKNQEWIASRTKMICRVSDIRERREVGMADHIAHDAIVALAGTSNPSQQQRAAVTDIQSSMLTSKRLSHEAFQETGC